jgi:hypothetical protein
MTLTATHQADILARVFRPEEADMSEDAARSLLKLTFSAEDRERMDALAAKAREGSLSDEEVLELENYERVNNLLGIMKSKARRCLKQPPPNGQ